MRLTMTTIRFGLTSCLAVLALTMAQTAIAAESGVGFAHVSLAFPVSAKAVSITDVLVMNNGEVIEFGGRQTQLSPGDWFSGQKAKPLIDGNPETVFETDASGQYVRFDIWVQRYATDIVIHSNRPESLKGVQLDLLGDRLKSVYHVDLGIIPDGMNVAKINIKSGHVTGLDKVPELKKKTVTYPTFKLNELVVGTPLPLTVEALSKIATVEASGPGVAEWIQDADGVLRLESQDGRIRFNQHTLGDGEVFALTLDIGKTYSGAYYRPSIYIDDQEYRINRYSDLQDPHGMNWNTRTNDNPTDWTVTLVFHRKGDHIHWSFYGEPFNTSGVTEFKPGELSERASVRLGVNQTPGGWSEGTRMNPGLGIANVIFGTPGKALATPLPQPVKLAKWPKGQNMNIKVIRRRLKRQGIDLPKLHLHSLYGPIQPQELATLKQVLANAKAPKANSHNTIMFRNELDMAALFLILEITDDIEILNTLHDWGRSILDYRNDMPKGAGLPNMYFMYWNKPTKSGEVAKVWNYHGAGGWGWIDGKPHLGTEISGATGTAAMMHFPLYVSRHPELWTKQVPGTGKTYLQQAIFFARECQAVLDDFVYTYYIEDETGRAPNKPWNRYMQLVETCLNLAEVYDNFKARTDFYDQAKRDKCQRVVNGFVDYFFDTRHNYTRYTTIGRDDNQLRAVATWLYMPKVEAYIHPDLRKTIYPTGSEDYGHAAIEVKTFGEFFARGVRPDKCGLSWAHLFKNTVREKIYGGQTKDGKQLLNSHVNGEGSYSPGTMGAYFLWPSFIDPDLYDLLAKTKPRKERLDHFCHMIWLRQKLYDRGVTGPGEANRKAPRVKIITEKHLQDHNQKSLTVTLAVDAKPKDGRTIKRVEWDFDGDSTFDASGERVTHTFTGAGVYMAVVQVTDSEGWSSSKDVSFVIDELIPGNGTGTINGACWTNISSMQALKESPKFPNQPDTRFVQTSFSLDISKIEAKSNYGVMLEGCLHAPENGDYEFVVNVDDAGELWISEDDTPENLTCIHSVPSYMFFGRWSRPSAPLTFKKGKRYYFRTLYWQSSNAARMAIRWRKKGGPYRPLPIAPNCLSPVRPIQ